MKKNALLCIASAMFITVLLLTGCPTAEVAVTSVRVNPVTVEIAVGGEQTTLTATVEPSNATNKAVTWSVTAGPGVASVDNTGKVTAESAGTAVITVTTVDGGFTANCQVTVTGTGGGLGSTLTYTDGGAGTGTLASRGKAADSAKTYYIDAENGNDSLDGTSPANAWKSFRKANTTTFKAGDRILLEADSIWNGASVDASNFRSLLRTARSGMLWPQGSGTEGNPIVIDLYDIKYKFADDSVAETIAKGDAKAVSATVYYSANRRPIINGNGTPSADPNNPYNASAAIYLEGQDYWEIRNIEVTNSFEVPNFVSNPDLKNTHWYNRSVAKQLVGIMTAASLTKDFCTGIVIENCYAHDVQSLHNNNGNSAGLYTSSEFGGSSTGGKGNGGIIAAVSKSRIEGNIVKRVGLEGLRASNNSARPYGQEVIVRGNYIETTAGDGIVTAAMNKALIESNMVKDACASPQLGGGNYASNWFYYVTNSIAQYNESWGTLYGNLDGEAYDVDGGCTNIIYQYNLSHHNAGGACLFMGGQSHSIFRYNISIRDGMGSKQLDTVTDFAMNPDAYPYQNYDRGQSLFHYAFGTLTANTGIPLIHNNTFYIGDGYEVSIFGNTSTSSGVINKYARFYNNIVLKDGANGEVRLADMHNPGTSNQYAVGTLMGSVKNNIFWAPNKALFKSATANQIDTLTASDNKWVDPQLKIQSVVDAGAALRTQRNTVFPESDYTDPAKLKTFTSVAGLRARVSNFTPQAGSPAIEGGMVLPVGNSVSALDGANNHTVDLSFAADMAEKDYWNASSGITKDFFGNPVNSAKPPIGAAAK